VPVIIDTDTDATEGELSGPFDSAILEGLSYDKATGQTGWNGLETQAANEEDVIALAFTSGTTSKPKGKTKAFLYCTHTVSLHVLT